MPLTPLSWSGTDFGVNPHTTGTQNRSRIIQLSNGNIMVIWTDFDDGGPGFQSGADVIGRIFDPLGNPVSFDFQFNFSATSEDEQDAEVIALANGGFMVIYEDNGTDNNIYYEVYDAFGNHVSGNFLLNDPPGGDYPNSPVIACNGAGQVMTAWIVNNADGTESIWVRAYDPGTDVLGTAIEKLFLGGASVDDSVGGIALAWGQLTNNFALAIVNRNVGDDTILLRILDAAGATVNSASISPGSEVDDVQITGLAGGRFAIVWQNLTTDTISMAIYSSTGTVVLGPNQIAAAGRNEPSIAALADGGFVVVWDDDLGGTISGRRFNANGAAIGSEFEVDAVGATSDPNVVGLADGRFTVSWVENGNIRAEIFDARDVPNSSGVYSTNQWVVGTVFDDVFTAASNAEIVHGWDGNDIITEAANGSSQIYGDDGSDSIIVVSEIGGDYFDGGSGIDLIDWSAVIQTGATFDLQAGTATSSVSLVEQMLNFENLNGTNFADEIYGTSGSNILNGNNGDDWIDGRGGNDVLHGNDGNDTIYGNLGNDELFGGEGNDTLVADQGVDDLFGENGDDELTVESGGDGSRVYGGAGYDTLAISFANSIGLLSGIEAIRLYGAGVGGFLRLTGTQITNQLPSNLAILGIGSLHVDMNPGIAFSSALFTISSQVSVYVTGTAGADNISTGNARHFITSGGGIDTITGGNGDDYIRLVGASSGSFVNGGAGIDTLGVLSGTVALASVSGFEGIYTGAGANLTLTGAQFTNGFAANSILSGTGTIIVNLDPGAQPLLFKLMTEEIGSDVKFTINGTSGADVIKANDFTINTLNGGAGTDLLNGGDSGDFINGGIDADKIRGSGGVDVMSGGAGADIFKYRSLSDAGTGFLADIITDFVSGEDKLNFRRLDADPVAPGTQAFTFIGTAAFANNGSAQIRYVDTGADLRVDVDVNGDGAADMSIALLGAGAGVLTAADFLL